MNTISHVFFFYCNGAHRDLHSFPTRRSSDLGERVIAYAEPVGYGWKENGNGLFEFGFVVDFQIKSRDGEVLAEEENFMRIATESHRRNMEFFIVLKLNMGRAPPGDYIVMYKLHDIASDKTASFEMPFKLVAS